MEPGELLKRLVAARESWADSGRLRFKLRRPNEMELIRMRRGSTVEIGLDVIQKHVVGWEGVTEADIVTSGGSEPVAFDATLYAEWIADRPEHWQPISEALHAAIQAHAAEQGEDIKN
ncbi:MAG TPA: hypothetical protein VJ797_15485 [Burkholderiales bacterium]|nr:hypothetical protein [Burkholderiales bacterium]